MSGIEFSIKTATGKNHKHSTELDQSSSILECLGYDQTGRCLSSPASKGVIGKRMVALWLRASATRSASLGLLISFTWIDQ